MVLEERGLRAGLTNGSRVVEFNADGEFRWLVTGA